jgi:hypothetical protein
MHAEGRATLSAVRRRAGQSSRCRLLTQHGGDLLPAIDPAQLDLTARHEAEEQNDSGVLRSRLRSLWTQQGCTAARGHTKPTARRRPALPSTMHPRRERFAAAEIKGEQLLAAVDQDADDAEDRDAYHLAGAADAQGEAVGRCIRRASKATKGRLPVRAGASLRKSADVQTLPRDFEYAVTAGCCGPTFVFTCDGDGESGKGKRMGRRSRPRPHGGSILRAFDGSRRCVE